MPLPPGRNASSPDRRAPRTAPTARPGPLAAPLRRVVLLVRATTVAALALVATAVVLAPTACSQSTGSGEGPLRRAPQGTERHFAATADGRILDPSGEEFVPIGANVSIKGVFDWGGTADGHADTARAWGWNTVRLNVLVSDVLSWSRARAVGHDAFMEEVDDIVREYTDAGIVVVVDSHDLFMVPGGDRGVDAPFFDQIDRFWREAAERYQDNPYVWFNLHNEPPVRDEEWYAVNERTARVVRDTGARNPIVVDAQVWGQDLGPVTPQFKGAGFTTEPDMAPALSREFGNVILSQHNYGSFDIYTDVDAYGAYVDRVRAAGLPLLVGEFGMRADGVEEWPLQTDHNRRAMYTVAEVHRTKGVGALWWHANHTDGWSLFRDDTAFFAHTPGTQLSEGGRVMWGLTH